MPLSIRRYVITVSSCYFGFNLWHWRRAFFCSFNFCNSVIPVHFFVLLVGYEFAFIACVCTLFVVFLWPLGVFATWYVFIVRTLHLRNGTVNVSLSSAVSPLVLFTAPPAFRISTVANWHRSSFNFVTLPLNAFIVRRCGYFTSC